MKASTITASTAAALLAVLASCASDPELGRVVLMDSGAVDSASVHSLPYSWSGEVPGGHGAAWLAPGMFLFADEDTPFAYLRSDGERLSLAFTNWNARLSGRVVSLVLAEDSAVTWLGQASETNLAALRLVSLPDSLPPTMRPSLERLAAANPRVGLIFQSLDALGAVLPLFRPRSLVVAESDGAGLGLLAGQRQIETLYLSAGDSGDLDVLSRLPNLRRLTLDDWTVKRSARLPAGLAVLRISNGRFDPGALGGLRRLRVLSLTGSEWSGASDLAEFRGLRWLGFPKNATQAEFAAIVRAHQDLEVIELVGVESVTDLSPLRNARQLRALTLDGQYVDLSVLRELASLRFVGLSKRIWEKAPDQAAAIQAALPTAVVVKVTPLCLGSGWILALVPAVILLLLAFPRTRRV